MITTNKNDKSPRWWYAVALFVIVTIVVMWFTYPKWISPTEISDLEARGQHGDQYGGLNALFSGLAFAVLIFTVFLQSQELRLQRQELIETREELKKSAAANERMATANE